VVLAARPLLHGRVDLYRGDLLDRRVDETTPVPSCSAHRDPPASEPAHLQAPSGYGAQPFRANRGPEKQPIATRALLFDFDGTLIDTESVDLRSWQEVFAAHGVEVPLERFALRIGTLGGPDELDELEALLGRPCDRDAIQAERRKRELELLAGEPLRPGVAQYLDGARRLGLRLGVVSSSPRSWVDAGLARLGVEEGWAVRCCADGDAARCKPSPALYLEALAELGVAAGEAIAFEDSPNGVAAARAAGLFTVAVPNPVTRALDLSGASLVVDSLADLPLEDLLDTIAPP
jgi:HAD superfamily hydrolase (TIGR01509 family)